MNKVSLIARFVVAIITGIAALSIFISLIYIFVDYDTNIKINAFLDDFVIIFIIMIFLVFSFISFLLFLSSYKKYKKS